MSVARAPGKLVLSGAYSVFEGAPALVVAVDRYAVADSAVAADCVTEEILAAVERGLLPRPIGFDASALREELGAGGSRKLGLGSSAAVLVSSMAAFALERGIAESALAAHIFEGAVTSHRSAQRGGSGIDVAASCFGGVVACRLAPIARAAEPAKLTASPHRLPEGLTLEAWLCPETSVTADMLARVRDFASRARASYCAAIERAVAAAEAAHDAKSLEALLVGLTEQWRWLAELGQQAGSPIVTPAVAELASAAARAGAAFGPSGAGGGDVALFAGNAASSEEFRAHASRLRLRRLELAFGARGVHRG
ncbi:MAG: hypothetical protein EXR75_06110 [Myxococcales bacterium]|nr:hypothetical protein [Myxococcales bacterium]